MCESKGPKKPLGAVKVKFACVPKHTCAVRRGEVRSCCLPIHRQFYLAVRSSRRITGPSHDVDIGNSAAVCPHTSSNVACVCVGDCVG